MPRDPRLYMTFPIDFDEHPKVEPLSDAAFRTFVSMNGYSRRQRLDGRIPVAVARKRWRVKSLDELVQSHPEKPMVLLEESVYVIRDYAEHQFTTQDEAELYDRKARAGSAGGRAKAAAVAGAKQKPLQDVAGSESGLEIPLTDDGDTRPSVTEVDAGESEETEFIAAEADAVGIRSLRRVRVAFERVLGQVPSDAFAIDLTRRVIALSMKPVEHVEAYVEKACTDSPDEVRAQAGMIPTPEAVA